MDHEVGSVGSDAGREMLSIHPTKGAEKSSAIVCRFGFCERNESSLWVMINHSQTSSVEQDKDAAHPPHTVLLQPGFSGECGTEGTK